MEKSPQKQDYSPSIRELVVPPGCAGLRLDQTLAQLLPEHSRSRLAQWVRDGRVILDGHEASPRDKVWGGEALQVHTAADPRALTAEAQDIPLDIVYEDAALIVIDKPAGLVV